ncbi:MAG TPA: hypothetical protein VGX96_06860 [Candidatus Elarobacter sp.]|jgi:hypothetical protein|nr:hypothetical protein [Candidatus Elarobacter sp.]
MSTATAIFAQSAFVPIAVGFFGLGTGYFVWGGQALFGFPKDSPDVDRTVALWGIWMNGFMQFITGVYLMVGLTWFGVFTAAAPLYMAALAFTAYGVHWFAVAYRRYIGASAAPEAWMAIPFSLLGILGALVFFTAGDAPVGILFIGLTLVYLTEIPTNFGVFAGRRLIGLWQMLTGIWLMYLTYGVAMNLALGAHWWV